MDISWTVYPILLISRRKKISFLGIRSFVFSEILGQVRVPEMKKSDRARFFGKIKFLVISGGNVGKNQRFEFSFEISTLVLAIFCF